MHLPKKHFKLAELAAGLEVVIEGDPECLIHGVAPIQQSQAGHITFLNHDAYRKHLTTTQASAVILKAEDAANCKTNAIITSNPYYIYAKIASYFAAPTKLHAPGLHASAVLGDHCDIHPSVRIEAHCVIGDYVRIGANTVISTGSYVGDRVEIGAESQIDPRVTIYHDVSIGQRTRVFSGAVIGGEGFGFANQKGKWHKVPQLGSVRIGNDVEIGANTTIDRGTVEDTIIEDGVKLDNLNQVGHNVVIGANTIMAGCIAIAGSTKFGKNCMIGGASCFAGHLEVADNVVVTGMTAVTKSIREPGVYSSGIVGAVPNHEFRKNNARFYRLENLLQRVKDLENLVKKIISEK